VTATNTNIGKTHTTLQLLKAFAAMGLRVGVFKPIETGVNGLPADGNLLLKQTQNLNRAFYQFKTSHIVPISLALPAAPYIANKGAKMNLSLLDNALRLIESHCDIILIEGAGGLMTPIDDELFMIDLITHFKATALLVTHCHLGCINDTLLNLKILESQYIPHVLAFNCRGKEKDFSKVSLPYFQNHYYPIYHVDHDIKALAHALLDKIT
jgi:dethiobiotin synthetase